MTLWSVRHGNPNQKFISEKTEVFSVGSYDIEYARVERKTTIVRCEGKSTKTVSGFCLEGEVKKFGSTYKPQFVKPEFFEYIKTHHAFSDYKKLSDLAISFATDTVDENWGIVWFDGSSHTLLDSNHDPLPYASSHDYSGSPFSNRYVELNDEFLNFLREHPWVVNKKDLRILDIPYYNAEEGRDRYVQVLIQPDPETYKEMFCFYETKKGGGHISCQVKDAICSYLCLFSSKEKDWFGIRPFLKHPPK